MAGRLYLKPTCTTCRRATALLESLGARLEKRDIGREPLTETELRALIPESAPLTPFLNTRTALYRERRMKVKPPSRAEAIRLMARDPNLLRRPLLVTESGEYVHGFDEERYRAIFGLGRRRVTRG
jgi:Spx/MgsR family transcriptional regulator